jgi:hypothetical protein
MPNTVYNYTELRASWRKIYFKTGFRLSDEKRNIIGLSTNKCSKIWWMLITEQKNGEPLYLSSIRFLAEWLNNKPNKKTIEDSLLPIEAQLLLEIDSDWLLIWFSVEILRNLDKFALSNHGFDLSEEDFSSNQIERINNFHRITILIIMAFHIIEYPNSKERQEFIDISPDDRISPTFAQIELIAEYAYLILGINRELTIEQHLKCLVTPQILHYSSKIAYRDHLYHVIDVCLIGHVLILIESDKTSDHWLFGEIGVGSIRNEKLNNYLRLWYIAAIFHDIGYTLGLLLHTKEYLKTLSSPEIDKYKGELEKGFKSANISFDEELKKNNFNWSKLIYKGESASKDHAVISAVHTHHLLSKIRNNDVFIKSYKDSLDAIILHESSFREIDIEKNPIAFLLLLCDRIQEWGRPRIQIEDISQKFISALRFEDPIYPETYKTAKYLGANLEIGIVISTNIKMMEWRITQKKIFDTNSLTFYLVHDAANYEESAEVVPSWIKLYSDFQKLTNLDKLKLDSIIIGSIHPRSSQLNKFNWDATEMELLRTFAIHEPKGAYLSEWTDNIEHLYEKNGVRIGEKPVQYLNCDNANEQLFITIKKWNNPGPSNSIPYWISYLPEGFYSDYAKWKKELLIKELFNLV